MVWNIIFFKFHFKEQYIVDICNLNFAWIKRNDDNNIFLFFILLLSIQFEEKVHRKTVIFKIISKYQMNLLLY